MPRVLVVDDVQSMQDFLAFSLAAIPRIEIDRAGDGVEAVRLVCERRYDVVLLDVNLPLMDGMKVLSLMRQRPETKETRVIVVTTDATPETLDKALSLGANRVMNKPVDAEAIIKAVREALGYPGREEHRINQDHRRASRVRIPVMVGIAGRTPAPAETWDVNPYGAFIATEAVAPVGAKLQVVLDLPHKGPVSVMAEVIHSRPRPFGPLPAGMGIKFDDSDARINGLLRQAFVSPNR
jgi:two-component system chemotaxis response regulator CheY